MRSCRRLLCRAASPGFQCLHEPRGMTPWPLPEALLPLLACRRIQIRPWWQEMPAPAWALLFWQGLFGSGSGGWRRSCCGYGCRFRGCCGLGCRCFDGCRGGCGFLGCCFCCHNAILIFLFFLVVRSGFLTGSGRFAASPGFFIQHVSAVLPPAGALLPRLDFSSGICLQCCRLTGSGRFAASPGFFIRHVSAVLPPAGALRLLAHGLRPMKKAKSKNAYKQA